MSALGSAGRLGSGDATGQLFYDPDGNGAARAQQIATPTGAARLAASVI